MTRAASQGSAGGAATRGCPSCFLLILLVPPDEEEEKEEEEEDQNFFLLWPRSSSTTAVECPWLVSLVQCLRSLPNVCRQAYVCIMDGMDQKDSAQCARRRLRLWHTQSWFCWCCTSRCVPSCFRQAPDARHHGRYEPEGLFRALRFRQWHVQGSFCWYFAPRAVFLPWFSRPDAQHHGRHEPEGQLCCEMVVVIPVVPQRLISRSCRPR